MYAHLTQFGHFWTFLTLPDNFDDFGRKWHFSTQLPLLVVLSVFGEFLRFLMFDDYSIIALFDFFGLFLKRAFGGDSTRFVRLVISLSTRERPNFAIIGRSVLKHILAVGRCREVVV